MNKTIKILRIALDANPESWETRRHLAELLMTEGDVGQAREILAAATEVPATDDDELFLAENLLEYEPAKAASFVDRTLRRNKGSAQAHWLKAQVFQALGLMEDARKHYTTATVLDDSYTNGEFESMLDGSPATTSAVVAASAAGTDSPSVEPVAADAGVEPAESESEAEAELPTETTPVAEEAALTEEAEASPVEEPEPVAAATPSPRLAIPSSTPSPMTVSRARQGIISSKGKKKNRNAVRPKPVAPAAAAEPAAASRGGGAAMGSEAAWSFKQLSHRMKATQAKAKKKNRTVAVFCAGVLHALIILLCLFWILKPGPLPEPTVIMSLKAPEDLKEQIEKKAIAQYLPQRPSSSSASRANVIAANTTSPLAVPVVEIEEVTDDILGAGDSFGMGSGWGDGMGGGGGGSVRFFGDEKQAKRVCYIVDFSYSMGSTNVDGDTRQAVLKRELKESIKKLAPSMRYTVIFFSGMPWLQGENPGSPKVMGRQRMQDVALDVTWYDASKKNKAATLEAIDGMSLAGQQTGGGTIWMSGFRPAMKIKPKPDLVYLLSDGMCQDYISMPNASYEEFHREFVNNTKAWEGFLGLMLGVVPKGVSVNTIAMEVPGTVAARLAELAAKTGGDFSIVYEGKTYTGKRALRFGDKDYD